MEFTETELKYFICTKITNAYSTKKSAGYEQINNDNSQKLLSEIRNQCYGAYEFAYFKKKITKEELNKFEKYFNAIVEYYFDDVIEDCINDLINFLTDNDNNFDYSNLLEENE